MVDDKSDTTGKGDFGRTSTSGRGKTPPEGPACQSCGRALRRPDLFGCESSGAMSTTYCRYCYWKGEFTEPEISLEQMIEKVADMMVFERKLHISFARKKAEEIVPKLKRWKKG